MLTTILSELIEQACRTLSAVPFELSAIGFIFIHTRTSSKMPILVFTIFPHICKYSFKKICFIIKIFKTNVQGHKPKNKKYIMLFQSYLSIRA